MRVRHFRNKKLMQWVSPRLVCDRYTRARKHLGQICGVREPKMVPTCFLNQLGHPQHIAKFRNYFTVWSLQR